MAIDSSDNPWVVYGHPLDPTFGPWKPVVLRRDGTSWSVVGSEYFSEGSARNLAIAIDSADTPYVVFTDEAHGKRVTVMRYGYP